MLLQEKKSENDDLKEVIINMAPKDNKSFPSVAYNKLPVKKLVERSRTSNSFSISVPKPARQRSSNSFSNTFSSSTFTDVAYNKLATKDSPSPSPDNVTPTNQSPRGSVQHKISGNSPQD